MAPRDIQISAVDSLQAQLDRIALQAKERNPDGFRLTPIESLRGSSPQRSVSNSSSSSSFASETSSVDSECGKVFHNAESGQQVVLCAGVHNMSQHLQIS